MFKNRKNTVIPEVGESWRGTISHEDLVNFLKNISEKKIKMVELKIYNGVTVWRGTDNKIEIINSEIWIKDLGIIQGTFKPTMRMEAKEINVELYYPSNPTTNAFLKIELN